MSYQNITPSYSSARTQIFKENRFPYNVSCNFSKNLKALNSITSDPWKKVLMPSTLSPFDTKKVLRKYFSKKVVRATCFITNFPENSNYRCKELKSLTLIRSCNIKARFNSLKELKMIGHQESTYNGSSINKIFFSCKNLMSLMIKENQLCNQLQNIRFLQKLESLELTIDDDQLLMSCKAILRLKNLKTIKISIKGTNYFSDESQQKLLLVFMKLLLSKPKLKLFLFNILDALTGINGEFIAILLNYLNQSNILDYQVQATLSGNNAFGPLLINHSLQQINFFSLRLRSDTFHPQPNFDEDFESFIHKNNPAKPDCVKRKRILEISLIDYGILDIGSILKECEALRGLSLDIEGGSVTLESFSQLTCSQTLRDLALYLHEFNEKETEKVVAPLIKMIGKFCMLEGLRLYYSDLEFGKNATENNILDICKRELIELENLQKLELSINVSELQNITEIHDILNSLRVLNKLSLEIKTRDIQISPSKIWFPLEKFKEIMQLRIILPFSMNSEWVEYFTKNLSKLSKLETLLIQGHDENGIDISLLKTLMKKCRNLRKLKKLSINLNLITDKSQLQLIPNPLFYVSNRLDIKKPIITVIKDQIRDLIDLNSALNKVRIYEDCSYDIEYVQYE